MYEFTQILPHGYDVAHGQFGYKESLEFRFEDFVTGCMRQSPLFKATHAAEIGRNQMDILQY